jgi:phosphoribosylformimino-5-aminoimidazole carboxamide ribotide isomerase
MRVIPVLDLLAGVVVRGVAGQRAHYKPLKSQITSSVKPLEVARALREALESRTLYVADLDAIVHRRPNLDLYARLAAEGFECLVDAGLRDLPAAREVLEAGAATAVVGLETWPSARALAALLQAVPAERLVFSLDLHEGVPLADSAGWGSTDPFRVARSALEAGVTRMIVLDLGRVGTGQGVSTLTLCRRLRAIDRKLELITGGGVRDARDLQALCQAGIDGVLVASALHDGRLTRRDVQNSVSLRR